MIIGIEYFPSLRAAEEARIAEALERRRVALERQPVRAPRPAHRLRVLLTRSRRHLERGSDELDEAGSPLPIGPNRA